MPIANGIWKANVNGTEADLTLDAPNLQGVITGQLFGAPLRGFWDELSQSLAFLLVVTDDAGLPIVASFKAHLFRSPAKPEPGRDLVATLTGSLEMSAGNLAAGAFPAIGTAKRSVFGWFAQISEIQ